MRRVRVGDVLQLHRRQVEVDPSAFYHEIGVRSFGRGIFHKEPIRGIDLGKKRVFEIHPGDLVLSNVFAWEGAVALASDAENGRIGSHRFMTYRPRVDEISVAYLRYFFTSEIGVRLLGLASPGSAGRNRTLAVNRFEAIEFSLPTFAEQHRIASHLDRVFSITQSIHGQLSAREKIPARALLPGLVDKVIGRSNAEQVNVGLLYDVVSDVVHPGDSYGDAECFVGLQHIESHTGRRIGSLPLGDERGRKFRFRSGDITFGYLAPYLNKVWVADRVGLCSVDQYVLRPHENVDAELLAYVLRSASTLAQSKELTHNLVLPRLRSKLLASIVVADPRSLGEKTKERLDRVTKQVLRLSEAERRRADLCSSVMPSALNRAFAGLE